MGIVDVYRVVEVWWDRIIGWENVRVVGCIGSLEWGGRGGGVCGYVVGSERLIREDWVWGLRVLGRLMM
jgi:hypothetical protein